MKLTQTEALRLYDTLGYSVIPLVPPAPHGCRHAPEADHAGCCTCIRQDGTECQSPGKHPALGAWTVYQQRRATPEEIAKWWPYQPRYAPTRVNNIGVVTGAISNLVVLDLDDDATYELVTQAAPWLLDTMTVRTGRGWHIYLTPSEPVGRTTTFRLNGHLHHVKSDGGYVVAPPSRHVSGGVYTIIDPGLMPSVFDPRDLTAVLLELGAETAKPEAKDGTLRASDWVAISLQTDAPDGERNERATELAGWFRNVILYRREVALEILLMWNELHCKPPLPRAELEMLVNHKYDRYPPPATGLA